VQGVYRLVEIITIGRCYAADAMRRALIVVGKAPVPGRTKTRLVPPLSNEDAARLSSAFLLDTLRTALSLGWERTTLVHPRGQAEALRGLVDPRVALLEQPRDGLGEALAYAFEHHFEAGYERVTLIGSDNPTLPVEPILAANTALEAEADLTLGPTADGGYYLIGMRQPHLGVFERIDWSTSRVYAQTLARADDLGLRVRRVAQWYDVDEPADLARLERELSDGPASLAPNTRTALSTMRAGRAHQAPGPSVARTPPQ
jgi:rSAM/selenodomain-associated transferase 1